jgi:hypothetical protein
MRTGPGRSVTYAAALLAGAACAAPVNTPPSPSPGPVAAAPVTYAPGTARYRRASHLSVQQGVGGQTQHINEVLVYFVSATLARQGDRMTLSLTVDSVPRYEANGPATDLAARARGATFTGEFAPTGVITGLRGGDSSNKLVQQLAEELPNFYPRISSTGVEPLSRWTDTTETTSRSGGLPLTVVAVSQHEAEMPADSGAASVLPIRTLTTYSFSGSGSQGGQAYSVQGEGRRHTIKRLSLGGRFLGMTAADTSSYTISLRGLDVSIPARQTRADTLSIIP